MTDFRKRDSGEILTRYQLSAAFPDVSLPADVSQGIAESLGLDRIEDVPPPSSKAGKVVESDGIEQVDGAWRKRWKVRDCNAEELAQLRESLMQRATEIRKQKEVGGMTLPNGMRVGTSDVDRGKIANALLGLPYTGLTSVDFKAQSGWVTLGIKDFEGLIGAIGLFQQACFSAERRHHERVKQLGDADLAGYDMTAGWP